jgi:hypothetical protein
VFCWRGEPISLVSNWFSFLKIHYYSVSVQQEIHVDKKTDSEDEVYEISISNLR